MQIHFLQRLAAVACVLLVAGCSGAGFADMANLNDPRVVVDESANGSVVTLKQGGALVVRLPTQPADGLQWALQPFANAGLRSPIQRDYAPDSGPATLPAIAPYSGVLAGLNPPGMTESTAMAVDASRPAPLAESGVSVFRLRGIAPGTATVQLDYRPVDQPAAAPAKTVRFDVAVIR